MTVEGKAASVLSKIGSKYKEISYSIQDANEADEDEEEVDSDPGVIRDSRLRNTTVRSKNEDERKKHQDQLYIKKLQELKDRFERKEIGRGAQKSKAKNLDGVCSYKSEKEFPKELFKNHIYVDCQKDSVIVPISKKMMVPIHISVIKNVSITTDGKWHHLRMNFHIPSSGNSNVSSHLVFPPLTGKNRVYIKELTFKNNDGRSLPSTNKQIKELQKRYKQKSVDESNKKGLVKQDDLEKIVGKKHQLDNLTVRPNISGKKTIGRLECHKNGLKFVSNKNEEIVILFNNIKHAIFQPCDDELIVLIHFLLINEIIIGSKRNRNVQFLTEAGSQFDDLDQRNRRRMNDLDELEIEQREINLKKRLNKRFLSFIQQVESVSKHDITSVQFDVPYKELSFYGNTGKSIVKIMPTVN